MSSWIFLPGTLGIREMESGSNEVRIGLSSFFKWWQPGENVPWEHRKGMVYNLATVRTQRRILPAHLCGNAMFCAPSLDVTITARRGALRLCAKKR